MTILTLGGMARIPFLAEFLGKPTFKFRRSLMSAKSQIAGWGAKPSGRRAERLASKNKLPALFLEDGFLRSYGTGDRFPPLSLVVDTCGIYYDASRPSALENMLNSDADLLNGIADDVAKARNLMLRHQLSKYNHAPPLDPAQLRADDKMRVLVVDQTFGDLSIALGGATAETFQNMLEAARAENPDATIYVKTHPEVISGRKGGHFGFLKDDERTVLLRTAINPLSLIEHMDKVYVVTSTMGFEALLAGKPVSCFGMPWYAGWGATYDRVACPRRTKHRSVDALFAAGYFHYARYLNPVTRERGTIFDVIDWLVRQKRVEALRHGENGRGRLICVGFRRWRQFNLSPILSLHPERVLFAKNATAARQLKPSPDDALAWWGREAPSGLDGLARESNARTLRIEDGFIRSVGLGSDLIAPLSLVLDSEGIYFDPRQASDLENILASSAFPLEEIEQAARVRRYIVDHRVTKYNLEPNIRANWPTEDRPVILVPGQVEDDASIRFGCTQVRTNLDLLKEARAASLNAFIVYKPHPDVMSRNRLGKVTLDAARAWADHIETDLSVVSCIEGCDEVHTMTSLTGFDALLRGKRVVTYGQPFYAGWGLTIDREKNGLALKRRQRRLTLDELVAGTLLRYPLYWDPTLKGYTTCEAVAFRIVERRDALERSGRLSKLKSGQIGRLCRKARVLIRAFTSL